MDSTPGFDQFADLYRDTLNSRRLVQLTMLATTGWHEHLSWSQGDAVERQFGVRLLSIDDVNEPESRAA